MCISVILVTKMMTTIIKRGEGDGQRVMIEMIISENDDDRWSLMYVEYLHYEDIDHQSRVSEPLPLICNNSWFYTYTACFLGTWQLYIVDRIRSMTVSGITSTLFLLEESCQSMIHQNCFELRKSDDVSTDMVTDRILSTIYHSYVLPKILLLIKFWLNCAFYHTW